MARLNEHPTLDRVRLNLGAGSTPVAGYLSVDADPAAQPDIAAAIDRLPYRAGSVDEIIAYHVIEHVNYWEAEAALSEWYRVLRPGGSIAIECPNIERVVQALGRSNDYTKWSQVGMWGVYGDPNHRNPFYSHKWGYTPLTLGGLLFRAGFTDVVATRPQTHVPTRDLRLEAHKPDHESHPLWREPGVTEARTRVFWFLVGGFEIASSRIHGYRIHEYLRSHGWSSHLLLTPRGSDWIGDVPLPLQTILGQKLFRSGDIAVFQKLSGMNTAALIEQLTALGVKTVFIDCDLPVKPAEASVALWTICTSSVLAQEYRDTGNPRVVYLPEPTEDLPVRSSRSRRDGRIRCLWFGNWSVDRARDVDWIRSLLTEPEFADLELRVIANSAHADAPWHLDTIGQELADADIAVIPVIATGSGEKAKSANRVTQAMSAGLPVIASDIPAYRQVVETGWNGFLCTTPDEWRSALRALRDNGRRAEMSRNAADYARETASLAVVGALWEHFLVNLGADWQNRPSNIVTHFRSYRLRSLLYAGIAMRGTGRFGRVRYLLHAWLMWPFSVALWRITADFAGRAWKRLGRRIAPAG